MARPNAHVDHIREMARPRDGVAPRGDVAGSSMTVTFAAGRTGRLELTSYRSRVWAQVLQSLHERGQPAYVEIDKDTNLITELLQPLQFTVGAIREVDGALEVDLVISQARHYVSRSNPDFTKLRQALEAARKRRTPMLVTETLNEHEIIDVRPAKPRATPRR